MLLPSIRVLLVTFVLLSVCPLCADIAPVQYVGYGISPVKANGVRMLSAHVDITWGTPCTMSAAFVMDNQTAKPVDIQLGFPIQKVYSRRRAERRYQRRGEAGAGGDQRRGGQLPKDMYTQPTYHETNPADAPILVTGLTSDTLPITTVDDYAESILEQKLSQVPGVGLVNVGGEQHPSIRIQFNPAQLAANGLDLEDVRQR